MVATRNHPKDFDSSPPEPSPTKRSTRSSTSNLKASSPPETPTKPSARPKGAMWSHTPSNLSLLWLALSLPLVIWDTGYVLLRPHTLPGGSLHWPLWSPYELYGRVDKVYGVDAWESGNGWTAAQGFVNLLETSAYLVYLYLVFAHGVPESVQGRGAPEKSALGPLRALGESRTLSGRLAGIAVVTIYTTATITFWKTVLYWLIEVFSGFHCIGHNDLSTIFFLWVLPNGPWLVLPLYIMYVTGAEILEGLDAATAGYSKTK